MSKLYKALILTTSLILLSGCSTNKSSKVEPNVVQTNHEIKESAPIKLKRTSSQDKVVTYKKKNTSQRTYQALSKPLEANKKMTEVYLLQLKALELMIKNLEKVN